MFKPLYNVQMTNTTKSQIALELTLSSRMASIFLLQRHLPFVAIGHIDKATAKMQIHIQFHGSESTQNSLNSPMENRTELQSRDRLDKMIHRVRNSLGCQALLAFSVSSSFRPLHTPKEY